MSTIRTLPRSARKLALAALLLSGFLPAQNLVPNPGFEELKQVPCEWMSGDMSSFVNNWNAVNDGTSDILSDKAGRDCYANCHSTNGESAGEQSPHTGQNMAFIVTHCQEDGSYREYIGTDLKAPLIPGKKYYVEMWVSTADHSPIATNNIGFCFFTGSLTRSSGYVVEAMPQVNEPNVIDNDQSWVKVSGFFTADKAYTWLALGNFLSKSSTTVKKRPNATPKINDHGELFAGYFIDDVVVRPAETNLSVKGDTLVMIGTTAQLKAYGSKTYQWADSARPKVIIGHDAEYKALMNTRRTFLVYGDNNEVATITVNVIKPQAQYVQNIEGRKVKKGRTVEVHSEQITVTVYDDNKVDGDSISLFYGDSCIVRHYALTKKKKSFTIRIDKAHPQQLILYAENQGTQPPNTASVSISDGRTNIVLVLSSDLKNCDSVLLLYKKED